MLEPENCRKKIKVCNLESKFCTFFACLKILKSGLIEFFLASFGQKIGLDHLQVVGNTDFYNNAQLFPGA